MKPSEGSEAIHRWRNPRFWLYCLVLGVTSGLVAIVTNRIWGETAAMLSFLFTCVLIPGVIGLERWIDA